MKVVVDTNKLLATILKSGKIRHLLIFSPIDFYTLSYAIDEIKEHRDKICRRVKLDSVSFDYILNNVVVPELKLPEPTNQQIISEARNIAINFDLKDYPFIALALELDAIIWTNDKDMIKYGLETNKYLAIDTSALELLLRGESIDEIKKQLIRRYLKRKSR